MPTNDLKNRDYPEFDHLSVDECFYLADKLEQQITDPKSKNTPEFLRYMSKKLRRVARNRLDSNAGLP
jgi:hypothetical protein